MKSVPQSPTLSYINEADNELELKRLRLSHSGFELLDKCGVVSIQEEIFTLNDPSGSYRPSYLEEDDEYLQQALWSGLHEILPSEVGLSVKGVLEYYGHYYLVAEEESVVLYSLGLTRAFDGCMTLDDFCKNAWEFYCYVENYPTTIYGGNGLFTDTLPR